MIRVGSQVVVELGKGDVKINVNMGNLNDARVGFVSFEQIEKGIVARKLKNERQTIPEIFSSPLVLQFENKQGVDALISALERIKESFIKPETLN
jgi:hypothetical protein